VYKESDVTAVDAPGKNRSPERLREALFTAVAAYAAANPKSAHRHAAATEVMPGGNTRSVLFFPPFPLCLVRGEGNRLWDADGHGYVDFLGEFTAGIFGHSNAAIRAAIDRALDNGINLSGHNRLEADLAAVVCARFPSIDLVRFTNSGTEANLMAIATAIAHTGRSKIVVFEGGYHGGVLSFPPGGSRVNVPHEFVLAPYNDLDETMRLIRAADRDLAGILVEPMLGAGGCIPATPEFLAMLREEATRCGAVLIFDEVMTSRLSPGGRQAVLGIVPDMTTLGKYIGGGMSFGAFGGRADLMSLFDPRRPDALGHAGTFNNNTVTMAAGLAGMTEVLTTERTRDLNQRGDRLRDRLNRLFMERGACLRITGLGSVMNIHAFGEAAKAARELVFFDLIARGLYLAHRGLIALSLPITDSETAVFADAMSDVLAARRDVLCAPATG
jgi:glutamate-1-semialdehyde 2,1-aminomutase